MTCTPGTLFNVGDFIFPVHNHGDPYTPVDIPIEGCGLGDGLAMLSPAGGSISVPVRVWGIPDADFNWSYTGWWIAQDYTLHYSGRTDTHIVGVTRYPSKGKIDDHSLISTGYYNPNAYWTPAVSGDPPPPGGDPAATPTSDPTTLNPPASVLFTNRPYKYAVLKTYDFMGVNRTGIDLYEKPDHAGEYFDPYDSANHVLKLVYDDQGESTVKDIDFEPDGENVRNQQVSLFSAVKEGARSIRKIGRNRNSRKEIGVFSDWEAIGGGDVTDVSEDNVAGHAAAAVESYGRPPNHFTVYLHLEPAQGTPARGDGEEPAAGWLPQYRRDFKQGDRVIARMRKGFIDTGEIPVRIMHIKVAQADANNNVQVTLDVVPATGDLSEVEVVD